MDKYQSEQSPLNVINGDQESLYPSAEKPIRNPVIDDSRCDCDLRPTERFESIYLGKKNGDECLDRVAVPVLLGWGVALVIFIVYTSYLNGSLLGPRGWEIYQITAQTIATISTLLAILIVIREVHHSARITSSQEGRNFLLDLENTSFVSSLRSWLLSSKVAIPILVALCAGLPGKYGLLQVLTTDTQSHHSNVTLQYNYLSEVDMASRYALCCAGLFAEYNRLLLSQGEYMHSQSDFYGNIKVPDLALLKGYSEDDGEWASVPSDKDIIYSSLLGIPVSGVPITGNTTFVIETSYYSVKCDNVTLGRPQKFWIIDGGDAISETPIFNGPFSKTNTTFGLDSTASFSIATAGFQKFRWPQRWDQIRNTSSDSDSHRVTEAEPQPLLIQSTYYGSSIRYVREHQSKYWQDTVVSAYCTVQMHYVSVNVTCTPSSCAATSMRPSRMPHPNINMTDLGNIRAFYEFTRELMIAGRDGHANLYGDLIDGNTLTEYFLQDPYFGSNRDNWGNHGPYIGGVRSTPEEFGARIQMVLNGFRMLNMGGTVVSVSPAFVNTRFTTGDNVTEESVVIARRWKLLIVMFWGIGLIVSGVVEMVTNWRARGRRVQLR